MPFLKLYSPNELQKLARNFRVILATYSLIHPMDKALMNCAQNLQQALKQWQGITAQKGEPFSLGARQTAVDQIVAQLKSGMRDQRGTQLNDLGFALGITQTTIAADSKKYNLAYQDIGTIWELLANARKQLEEAQVQFEKARVDDGF